MPIAFKLVIVLLALETKALSLRLSGWSMSTGCKPYLYSNPLTFIKSSNSPDFKMFEISSGVASALTLSFGALGVSNVMYFTFSAMPYKMYSGVAPLVLFSCVVDRSSTLTCRPISGSK